MFKNLDLNKELIWITLINYGYINYTKNFLKSMERANIQFKLIVYCIDEQTYNELSKNEQCICLRADFLKKKLSSDMKSWGKIEYKQIVFAKLDAILYTLQNTYDIGIQNIGYIDTDIYLFSDPSTIMLKELEENKDINIFSQCDEYENKCSNNKKCKNICSGVIVFRNKKELYNLFEYTEQDIMKYLSDQHYLAALLNTNNIPSYTIDKSIMPNGAYYKNLRKEKIQFELSNCLIHFNYMVGNDKENAMKLQGLWII